MIIERKRQQGRPKAMPTILAWPKVFSVVTPVSLAGMSGRNEAEPSDQAHGDVKTHVTRFCCRGGRDRRAFWIGQWILATNGDATQHVFKSLSNAIVHFGRGGTNRVSRFIPPVAPSPRNRFDPGKSDWISTSFDLVDNPSHPSSPTDLGQRSLQVGTCLPLPWFLGNHRSGQTPHVQARSEGSPVTK